MVQYFVGIDSTQDRRSYSASDINELRAKLMKKGKTHNYYVYDSNKFYIGMLIYASPVRWAYVATEGWTWVTKHSDRSYVAKNGRLEYNKDVHYPQYKR